MATIYSNQYKQAYNDVPSSKIAPGDFNGTPRFMFFDYDIVAAPTNGDVLKLGKIPKGARVIDAVLSFPDLGTAGVLNLGWAASAELSAGVAVEAADNDGFMVSVDVNAAAATMGIIEQVNVPGFLKEFSAEVDVQIDIATAWTVTSGKIKGYISYVLV